MIVITVTRLTKSVLVDFLLFLSVVFELSVFHRVNMAIKACLSSLKDRNVTSESVQLYFSVQFQFLITTMVTKQLK